MRRESPRSAGGTQRPYFAAINAEALTMQCGEGFHLSKARPGGQIRSLPPVRPDGPTPVRRRDPRPDDTADRWLAHRGAREFACHRAYRCVCSEARRRNGPACSIGSRNSAKIPSLRDCEETPRRKVARDFCQAGEARTSLLKPRFAFLTMANTTHRWVAFKDTSVRARAKDIFSRIFRRDRKWAFKGGTKVRTRPTAFLHFPKSAGTSFRFSLCSALGAKVVVDGFDHSIFGGFTQFDTIGSQCRSAVFGPLDRLPPNLNFVSGHFAASTLRRNCPDADMCTVLREPISRIISFWLFWRQFSDEEAIGPWGPVVSGTATAPTNLRGVR